MAAKLAVAAHQREWADHGFILGHVTLRAAPPGPLTRHRESIYSFNSINNAGEVTGTAAMLKW